MFSKTYHCIHHNHIVVAVAIGIVIVIVVAIAIGIVMVIVAAAAAIVVVTDEGSLPVTTGDAGGRESRDVVSDSRDRGSRD